MPNAHAHGIRTKLHGPVREMSFLIDNLHILPTVIYVSTQPYQAVCREMHTLLPQLGTIV